MRVVPCLVAFVLIMASGAAGYAYGSRQPPCPATVATLRPALSPTPTLAAVAATGDIPAAFARLGLVEGAGYAMVRRTLADAGYAPATLNSDACASVGGERCGDYPEIEACAGTGEGLCSARFVTADGAVYAVITAGPAGPLVRIFRQDKQ